ncbi:MAG: indolepyruvate ferredoxin oxidoreductase, beta subunit, partial [Thermoanaerobacteraceae bacterium]|nr:indolepyruvate ferredoxin oxidoreductase, beta subunit [Thermoanaerobacteraceae bacterium]
MLCDKPGKMHKVKMSEVHGTAHVLLAFEKLEAARFLHYLSEEGTLIVNDAGIPPVTTLMGQETYPQDLMQKLVRQVKSMVPVDA